MHRKLALFAVVCLLTGIPLISFAQSDIPVGSWRMHISYRQSVDIALGNGVVYCAVANGIFSFDKSDGGLATFNKINGLSDTGISDIDFERNSQILAIGYRSGNVDLVIDNQYLNYQAIKNAQHNDDLKTINHILFRGDRCYFSTGFGVVVFNFMTLQTIEAFQNLGDNGENLRIYQSQILEDTLFLASENGVIAGSLDGNTNLQDFNNWVRFDSTSGIPKAAITGITTFKNQIYTAIDGDGIYKYESGVWMKSPNFQTIPINSIYGNMAYLTISTDSSVWLMDENGNATEIESQLISAPNIAIHDETGKLWISDNAKSLITDFTGSFNSIMPSGPFSDQFYRLRYHSNKILGLPGGLDQIVASPGLYIFEGGLWTNYTKEQYDIADNLMDASYSEMQNTYLIPSSKEGISLWDGKETIVTRNSADPDYPFPGDLLSAVYSDAGADWISAYDTFPSIFKFGNSQWQPVDLGLPGQDKILEITRDQQGIIWFRINPSENGGIILYDPSNGQSRLLTTSENNGGLPDNRIYDIEVDTKGNVWIGTDDGVAYFLSNAVLFSDPVNAIRPIFDGQFLLDNEQVLSIATDGGNRKWMGTTQGVWLFGEFGDELIRFYDETNAPLLSNEVSNIEINPNTGEVFFVTPEGLSSFRNDGTKLENMEDRSIRIFPNPVDRDYTGYVSIEGVPHNSLVKITDIAGNLIWQTRAEGNTAIWNLNSLYGGKLGVGMYMIYSSSSNGEHTFVGKIAVVN